MAEKVVVNISLLIQLICCLLCLLFFFTVILGITECVMLCKPPHEHMLVPALIYKPDRNSLQSFTNS